MIASSNSTHLATLDRLIAAAPSGASPAQLFGEGSDEFWLWAFTDGYRSDQRLRQYRFAGAAGDATMRDAFGFYTLVRVLLQKHRQLPVAAILEFGCGWGRMLRLFLRDVEPQNLWGIDCLPAAIEICRGTNRYCNFRLVAPFPPSSLDDNTFDLVYAFSVFSHLSEAAHDKWLTEFSRILRPGGLLVVTTRSRDFILACAEARARHEQRDWAQGTVLAFTDTADALARYDRGEFVYEPVGGGDVLDKSFFGETCIPRQYVEGNWTRDFDLIEYIADRNLCQQNVIVVRKPSAKE